VNDNPLLFVFGGLAIVFLVLTVLLVVLQRRQLESQARAVRELLEEARRIAEQEKAGKRKS